MGVRAPIVWVLTEYFEHHVAWAGAVPPGRIVPVNDAERVDVALTHAIATDRRFLQAGFQVLPGPCARRSSK
jgi:hypothetical protein